MNSIDSLNSSLFFSAAAVNAKQIQKEQENSKIKKDKKKIFSSMLEKNQEMESLVSAGLPPQIAGLSLEDAVVYLKDAVDIAGDELSEKINNASIAKFRQAVGQFLKFVEKNAYDISTRKRLGKTKVKGISPYFSEVRDRDPYVQINIVNKKLAELTEMILQNHADKLKVLAQVDEIKGMIVDFFAI